MSAVDAVRPVVRAPGRHFVDGTWLESVDGGTIDVVDPATGETVMAVAAGGEADVDRAVAAASRAFPGWASTPAVERARLMHRLADAVAADTAQLAALEALDVGKAVATAEGFDVPFAVDGLRYFADVAASASYDEPLAIPGIEARTHLAPYGACGFIFPWNFPLVLFVWNVAPALAAGNTIVVKPSEVTPLSTLHLAQLVADVGFPPGVINVVVGDGPEVGAAIAKHPSVKHVAFTGSPAVGKLVGAACGAKPVPCKLELGGKGAAVVFDDVDVASTAEALAGALTLNTGQVCCTATRWIVHERIHDELVAAVGERLAAVAIGPGLARSTEMGPVVSASQRDRIQGYVERGRLEGGEVLFETGLPTDVNGDGYYVAPSILGGGPDNVCFREEIFGPVAYVTPFRTEEEAVELVNALDYGLANSVWSADLDRAGRLAERMVAGSSWINAHNVLAYGLPYGGTNLSGLGGGLNGRSAFFDYLRHQSIARPLAD